MTIKIDNVVFSNANAPETKTYSDIPHQKYMVFLKGTFSGASVTLRLRPYGATDWWDIAIWTADAVQTFEFPSRSDVQFEITGSPADIDCRCESLV